MAKPTNYILVDKKPVPEPDFDKWCKFFEYRNVRRVASTDVGKVWISTVFLGLDHRFSGVGPPILFETMIFGGKHDGYQDRCSTWDEAEQMHKKAVELVNGL